MTADHALIEALPPQRSDEPGLAVSVIRGGRVVASRSTGLASLTHRVPIGPGTRFHIVSISKTFLAAAALMLAARGRLRLGDDVRTHLPELPPEVSRGGFVTIRHLLSMTSGLADVLEIARLRGVWGSSPSRARDLLELAFRQRHVSAPAGAQYMYANVNFVLLEEIIARAAGAPAADFVLGEICAPLGLTATAARPHEGIVVPDLAEPYVPDGAGGWTRATDLLGIAGDTLTSSLDDLTRWVQALRAGAVAGVPVTAAMAERTRLRSGEAVHYGLGLAVRRYRGLTVLCHSGSQPGYKAHIAYLPERDLGLVILSNREDTRPTALATAIMEAALGDDFPASDPARAPRPEAVARTLPIAGTYVDSEAGEWVRLTVERGILHGETLGDPFFLYEGDDGRWRDGDDYRATVPVELRTGLGGGEPTRCRLRVGGQSMELVKCQPPGSTAPALQSFAGLYENDEMASRHRVRAEGDGLIVEYGPGAGRGLAFPMEPAAPDVFLVRPSAPGIAYRHVFRFERDAADAVTGAVVTMERLKRVRLERTRGGNA